MKDYPWYVYVIIVLCVLAVIFGRSEYNKDREDDAYLEGFAAGYAAAVEELGA